MWVYDTNLYGVYNYHDSRAYDYKQFEILLRLDGFGMVLFLEWFLESGLVWGGFGVAHVESCDP
jgi:hypothetical protein